MIKNIIHSADLHPKNRPNIMIESFLNTPALEVSSRSMYGTNRPVLDVLKVDPDPRISSDLEIPWT